MRSSRQRLGGFVLATVEGGFVLATVEGGFVLATVEGGFVLAMVEGGFVLTVAKVVRMNVVWRSQPCPKIESFD